MKNNSELISIIVPVYKVEKYLNRCIESILKQTYKNIEIILVDDDSPDNCPKLCDEYSAKYENITAIHLKNSGFGASGARNAGLNSANGKFIAFIDSDDYVHKDLLAVLKQGFDISPNVLLSMCSYKRVYESDNSSNHKSKEEIKLLSDKQAMEMLILDQTQSAVWGKLFSRQLFEQLRFPIGKHNEDMFVMPFLIHQAKLIAVTPQKLYYYYQDNESLCRASFNYNMLDMIDALAVWREHINTYHPDMQNKINSHYFSTILNMCQYLVKKTDEFGINKLNIFKAALLENYEFIVTSKHVSINNKAKIILLRLGFFEAAIRTIEYLKIKRYV